jgi:hypothetical protein
MLCPKVVVAPALGYPRGPRAWQAELVGYLRLRRGCLAGEVEVPLEASGLRSETRLEGCWGREARAAA